MFVVKTILEVYKLDEFEYFECYKLCTSPGRDRPSVEWLMMGQERVLADDRPVSDDQRLIAV